MAEITLASLTKADLEKYQHITVIEQEGEDRRVWDSRKIPRLVAPSQDPSLTETAWIRVASFEDEDLDPVFSRLAELDQFGEKRLTR